MSKPKTKPSSYLAMAAGSLGMDATDSEFIAWLREVDSSDKVQDMSSGFDDNFGKISWKQAKAACDQAFQEKVAAGATPNEMRAANANAGNHSNADRWSERQQQKERVIYEAWLKNCGPRGPGHNRGAAALVAKLFGVTATYVRLVVKRYPVRLEEWKLMDPEQVEMREKLFARLRAARDEREPPSE